jgi:ABC-type Fe3+ transport system permease subunit
MAQLMFVLSILVVLIAVIGFVYTYRLGRQQKWQEELDGPLPKAVQERPYLRNPIFLAYLLAALLAVVVIFYLSLRYWYGQ